MTMSRQLKWQHEKKAKGLCVQCGKKAVPTRTRCSGCLVVQRAYNKTNYTQPEKRKKALAASKRWALANPEYVKEYQRQWRLRKKLGIK